MLFEQKYSSIELEKCFCRVNQQVQNYNILL